MSVAFTHDDELSENEARERLNQDDPNELPASSQRGILRLQHFATDIIDSLERGSEHQMSAVAGGILFNSYGYIIF